MREEAQGEKLFDGSPAQARLPWIGIRTEFSTLPFFHATLEDHLYLMKAGIDLRVREVGGNEFAHPAQAAYFNLQTRFFFHLTQQAFV